MPDLDLEPGKKKPKHEPETWASFIAKLLGGAAMGFALFWLRSRH